MREVDPRVSSVESWQEETRKDPWFSLGVPWKPADVTATQEIQRMLDLASPRSGLRDTSDLAGLVTRVAAISEADEEEDFPF